MRRPIAVLLALGLLVLSGFGAGAQVASSGSARKHVLAWADVRNGYQHDSSLTRVGHDRAARPRIGRYDTFIRTDSQPITKQPIMFRDRDRHRHRRRVPGPQPQLLRRHLLFRRARDRSDARAARRSAAFVETMARVSWRRTRRQRRSSRGRSSARCSAAASTSIPGTSPTRPSWSTIRSLRDAGASGVRVPRRALSAEGLLAQTGFACSPTRSRKLDLRRRSSTAPTATSRSRGRRPTAKGRVFYSTLGHDAELWDKRVRMQMYFQALRWALRLVGEDVR